MNRPETGPMQFPGEAPGVYISNTDARILLHGRMGELKRIVRQCFLPDNPSAPVQQACIRASDDEMRAAIREAFALEGLGEKPTRTLIEE